MSIHLWDELNQLNTKSEAQMEENVLAFSIKIACVNTSQTTKPLWFAYFDDPPSV